MKLCTIGWAALGLLAMPMTMAANADTNSPAVTLVTLKLTDGGRITGTPAGAALTFHTDYAKTEIPWNSVTACEVSSNGPSVLKLKNGDQLRGRIGVEALKLETTLGKMVVPMPGVTGLQTRTSRSGGGMDGLILYFPFDEDGGAVVRDASGEGNDGKIVGAQFVSEGKIGGAYRVGRKCGHIEVPANKAWSFGHEPFSIALWINLVRANGRERVMIGCDEGGGDEHKWLFEFYEANIDLHINNRPRGESYIAANPWRGQLGQWHHVVVTRESTTFCIYVNGVCAATDQNAQPMPIVNAALTIGQAENLFVEGLLDEVMIFNRALAPEEVLALYQREGPLALGAVGIKPAAGKGAVAIKVRAELVDGSVVVGEAKPEDLILQSASLGKIAVPLAQLRELKFSEEGKKVSAKLRNNDVLVGAPLFADLKVTTAFGRVSLTPALLRAMNVVNEKKPETPRETKNMPEF